MDTRTRKTVESYDRAAHAYDASNDTPTFWFREFRALRPLFPGRRILEIGCGAGRDARLFLRYRYRYIGVDASRGLLRIAKKKNPHGTFRYMDLYHLRFPPKSFDGFWSVATLLHVPKRRIGRVLDSINRLLVPDGAGVITIKEKRNVDEVVIHQNKYGGVDRFFAFYRTSEFQRILREHGFRIRATFRKAEDGNQWLCFVVVKHRDV